jgi:hypothetical protein
MNRPTPNSDELPSTVRPRTLDIEPSANPRRSLIGSESLQQPMHDVENVKDQRPQRRGTQRPRRILGDIDCHADHHQADAEIRSVTPRSVPGRHLRHVVNRPGSKTRLIDKLTHRPRHSMPTRAAAGRLIDRPLWGAVESVALVLVFIRPPAVAPNGISCLISRHTHLGLRDIDSELQCLCFRAESHFGSDGCAASLLRGGEPVIAVHN